MITMKVGSGAKAPVRFVFSDDVSETTVTVYGDDSSDTVRAKLQRVLELEASQGLPVRQAGATLVAPDFIKEPLFDAAAAEAALAANGWESTDLDGLPEA